jgi:hemerythrin-like domain-containing protein
MSDEVTTYKLGATAPSLETIRDFLRDDHAEIKRTLAVMSQRSKAMVTTIEGVQKQVDTLAEWIDLLDKTIEANANTTVKVVED